MLELIILLYLCADFWCSVTASIGALEEFLGTTFEEYSQITNDKVEVFHRAVEYSLPRTLAAHVHSVFLAIDIPPPIINSAQISARRPPFYGPEVTPAILNSFYSITNNNGSSFVAQEIFATSNGYYSPSDVNKFLNTYARSAEPHSISDIGKILTILIDIYILLYELIYY